jgi:hypothetical protein
MSGGSAGEKGLTKTSRIGREHWCNQLGRTTGERLIGPLLILLPNTFKTPQAVVIKVSTRNKVVGADGGRMWRPTTSEASL